MIENQDILELIELFHQHTVKFILVGGYAVIHYTEPRYTKDIDFFVEPSSDNADAIISALSEFGVPAESLKKELFAMEGNFFKLGAPPWRVDLITSLKGVAFQELYDSSSTITLAGQEVKLVSKNNLIKIKKIAGRPQDLLDVEKLEKS